MLHEKWEVDGKREKGSEHQAGKGMELALIGLPDAEIAKRVGVSRQWVNRWRNQDKGFIEAMAERREILRARFMGRICALMEDALEILADGMRSENEGHA